MNDPNYSENDQWLIRQLSLDDLLGDPDDAPSYRCCDQCDYPDGHPVDRFDGEVLHRRPPCGWRGASPTFNYGRDKSHSFTSGGTSIV